MNTILVTGGLGFIGSNLVDLLVQDENNSVIVVDNYSYSANVKSKNVKAIYENVDVGNELLVAELFERYTFDQIYHLAAESHVDRSLDSPREFLMTNIVGTFNLLESFRAQLGKEMSSEVQKPRFLHVSTDEVFGSLGDTGYFSEDTPYDPRSPYSASKASSDHFARAWASSYGIPIVISNCSNNYGPRQHIEKLVPLTITRAISGKSLPIYGAGKAIRDWLYVGDHVVALKMILENGDIGRSYNIGTNNELTTLEMVQSICEVMHATSPREDGISYATQIEYVVDRPGHDMRYAIDASRISTELGWKPTMEFTDGLEKTVRWYLSNSDWLSDFTCDESANDRKGI